jgi:hypothetical protein
MQQIADWLEKLGMSEYAEHLAENEIDASVLHRCWNYFELCPFGDEVTE